MNYYFFSRRISDVDHIVPVIFSLLNDGIKSENIFYYQLFPDLTLKNIKKDQRIIFLKKNKVNFNESILSKIYINLFNFSNLDLKINFFTKIYRVLYQFLFYSFFNFFFKIRLKIILNNNNKKIILCDHGDSNIYLELVRLSNLQKIKIIALPHGLFLHNGHQNEKIQKKVFPKKNINNLNIYDYIIFCTIHDTKFNKVDYNKQSILGSARFCKDWCIEQKNFYSNKDYLRDASKINVLLLEEKNGQNLNSEFIPWIFEDEIKILTDYLLKNNNINLIVKPHPSKSKKDLFYKNDQINYIFDDECSTFQLIDIADIVVTTITSSLIDAFILDKKIIIPQYCSPFKMIWENYIPEILVNNLSDFISLLNEYSLNLNKKNYYDDFYKLFLCNNHSDILKVYSDKIKYLANQK